MCAQNYRQFSFGIAHIIKLENKNNIVEHCSIHGDYNIVNETNMPTVYGL